MALDIKPIPTLKGKEALAFALAAERNYKQVNKLDFSKQIQIADALLKEANLI